VTEVSCCTRRRTWSSAVVPLDDVEGVEDGDGVVELIVDGVLVAMERVECGDLDVVAERGVASLQTHLVGGTGSAGDDVEELGFHLALLVPAGLSGQVDHPGELLGGAAAAVDRYGGDVVRRPWLYATSPCAPGSQPRLDTDDAEPVETHESFTAAAVGGIWTRARVITRRRLGHRRGLPAWSLGRTKLWKALTHPRGRPSGRVAHASPQG
jgi:hypothetical protein